MSTHFHLSMKPVRKGRGRKRAAYIMRLEGYKVREDLRGSGAENLPQWADRDALIFFGAADKFERKNGTVGKELIVAVPRALPAWAQEALIAELVKNIAGSAHGHCFGFHVVKSSDGGTNPHLHLLWSERVDDGYARRPDRYFARATPFDASGEPKGDPRRGGCRKSRRFALFARSRIGFAGGPELLKLRRWWADRCSYWLAHCGFEASLSERSYKAQGIDRVPGVHLYESARRIAARGGDSHRVAANAATLLANVSKDDRGGDASSEGQPIVAIKRDLDRVADAASLRAALESAAESAAAERSAGRRRKNPLTRTHGRGNV